MHDDIAQERPLIVSYSYSGNTQRIAQRLQALIGGDWLEIHPWQPYPAAFPELLAQARREITTGYRPRLLPLGVAPRPYRVILAGTPNWCASIAPPLAAWLKQNRLAGKTLLPFCSHCGGEAGDIRGQIARLCPGADVREALYITGDGGDGLAALLRRWMERNGLANPAHFAPDGGAWVAALRADAPDARG